MRAGDFSARVGGDEFVVMVYPLTDPDGLKMLANKIIEVANRPFILEGKSLDISVSIGIAYNADKDITAKVLYQAADKAMYSAKSADDKSYFIAEPVSVKE